MPEIKLVATDMDGTLLNGEHRLSPANKKAVADLKARGIPLIVATGRARTDLAVLTIDELGLETPGIFLQGAVIHHSDGRILHQETFAPELAAAVVELAEQKAYSMVAYRGLEMFTARRDSLTDNVFTHNEATPQELGSLRDFALQGELNKLVIWAKASDVAHIRADLLAGFGERVRLVQALPQAFLHNGNPVAIEILLPHISKATALAWILAEYGLDMSEVLALGDGQNDQEMIAAAGIGVAMGNGHEEAKAAADFITLSNDADGFAHAIERFVLKA